MAEVTVATEAGRPEYAPVDREASGWQKAERLLRAVCEVLEGEGEAGRWLRSELGRVLGTRVPGGMA